jgi:hypothetical protein
MAVIKSKNVSTLTRALKTTQSKQVKDDLFSETGSVAIVNSNAKHSPSSFSGASSSRLRRSFRTLKSISSGTKGVDAMRDLWKQTGMKTNGRKLLVDTLVISNVENSVENERQKVRRRRCKRACRIHRRVHSDVTTSSSQSSASIKRSNSDSCSDTSPPYVDAPPKKPLTYSSSTEVYAEVYGEEVEKQKIPRKINHQKTKHKSYQR